MALPTPEEDQALRDTVSLATLGAYIGRPNKAVINGSGEVLPNIMAEIFTITDAYIIERNKRIEK